MNSTENPAADLAEVSRETRSIADSPPLDTHWAAALGIVPATIGGLLNVHATWADVGSRSAS